MTIPYIIKQIETKQFAMFSEKMVNCEELEISSEFGFSFNGNTIVGISKYNYGQGDTLFLFLELVCVFEIAPEGIEEIVSGKAIPKGFLQYMASIEVGTARGIIHTKTDNTPLHQFVLPPINLVEVIKEDQAVSVPS